MRICFLADAGSVNTQTWANHFADVLGHEVHVVSLNRVGEFSPSVRVHVIGSHSERLGPLSKLSYVARVGAVARIVEGVRPDLVVGYRVASYGYIGARVGVHPLVVVAQGQNIVVPRRSLPKTISARVAIRNADLIHTWAPHMARRLVELGADPSKILTCPRGIDLELFGPRPGDQAVGTTAVTTRTLRPGYRAETLVRAFAASASAIDGFTAAMAGGGDDEGALRRLAGELGVGDSIRFMGQVPNERLPELLRESAVYVSAVRTDGVSASLLEAMACGCFPVVRDNDANRHWLADGRTGLLVTSDDPAAYAEAIIGAWRDPALRARAAEENRAVVEERADIRRNALRIDEAYRKLASSVAGRPS
jgi:glycosyltransferase involved in cell wall biosynthesis